MNNYIRIAKLDRHIGFDSIIIANIIIINELKVEHFVNKKLFLKTHCDSVFECDTLESIALRDNVFDKVLVSGHVLGRAAVLFERPAVIAN